ncbi:hypothetical protein [Candidatus Thiodictyon syntrophicum]|jgi:hypothetical protein|uniref:Uncharacterized protein n=1 Tax=Candidatus Thiodictyon syntrophicum TaxID=1166950 RepID=A0A2K8U717_9GAMM|nr:hypothetical protein [Candidatus Thiodictyon syntrophicum]AUB81382.1 hypothetical protein THSYN_10740 [Candidatus Thiodictyon syntrophicum]
MPITDTLIKQILADAPIQHRNLSSPVEEAPDDCLLPSDIFDDAPDIEIFHERAPDSGKSFPESPASVSVLGTYRFMASPGMITLYRGNIETYWKTHIRHAQQQFPFVTTKDAERVLQLLVYSVYQHERFHYVCDFCRRLFGGSFDRWHEEALAVAWEWQWLRSQERWNSFSGLMHPTLRRIVLQSLFDHRSPGYRDWRQFAGQAAFHTAVTAYLYPASAQTFADTGFNFAAWAVAHVPDDANRAWDERIGS